LNPKLLNFLADPKSRQDLHFHKGILTVPGSNQTIPIISGIPSFIPLQTINKSDQRTVWIYDRLAFAYDLSLNIGKYFSLASEEKVRKQYIGNMSTLAKANILEIGAGTASNRYFLPNNIYYIGLDASFNMLKYGQEKLSKESLSAEFIHADAHNLPIRSKCVDIVLSMGSLQHFSNPFFAAKEMWRVRKAQAEIHILDEISQYPALKKGEINRSLQRLALRLFPEAKKRDVGIVEDSDYFALQIS